ncbi:MAG: SRPBCC family protein [Acidimicrobiia bacterium]
MEFYREHQQVYVSADEAARTLSGFVPAPPELLWEFISSPLLRPKWLAGISRIDQLDPSGRRRAGTLNHCMHGEDVLLQEFLDWRPPRYYTSRVTMPGGIKLVSTHEMVPAEGGSTVHDHFRQPKEKSAAPIFDMFGKVFTGEFPAELERLREVVGEALASASPGPEPELPVPDESKRLATSVVT